MKSIPSKIVDRLLEAEDDEIIRDTYRKTYSLDDLFTERSDDDRAFVIFPLERGYEALVTLYDPNPDLGKHSFLTVDIITRLPGGQRRSTSAIYQSDYMNMEDPQQVRQLVGAVRRMPEIFAQRTPVYPFTGYHKDLVDLFRPLAVWYWRTQDERR